MTTSTPVAKVPCAKCPFRKDVPIYLRRGRRVEIASTLMNGNEFPCHGTVSRHENEDGEEVVDLMGASFCAGAVKSLLMVGVYNQMMRIIERIYKIDLEEMATAGADVWDIYEWQNVAEGSTGDDVEEEEDVPTCNTVNANCIAPAGYMGSDGPIYGTEPADDECIACGEPVCSECIDEDGHCGYCTEREDDE